MKSLKLYGYVCGKEQATLVEELTVPQLQEWLDNGRFGHVGPTLCGCDMWEELVLCHDGTFNIMIIQCQTVPTTMKCLQRYIREGMISVDFFFTNDERIGGLQMVSSNCRAQFKLEDGKIVYIK